MFIIKTGYAQDGSPMFIHEIFTSATKGALIATAEPSKIGMFIDWRRANSMMNTYVKPSFPESEILTYITGDGYDTIH